MEIQYVHLPVISTCDPLLQSTYLLHSIIREIVPGLYFPRIEDSDVSVVSKLREVYAAALDYRYAA